MLNDVEVRFPPFSSVSIFALHELWNNYFRIQQQNINGEDCLKCVYCCCPIITAAGVSKQFEISFLLYDVLTDENIHYGAVAAKPMSVVHRFIESLHLTLIRSYYLQEKHSLFRATLFKINSARITKLPICYEYIFLLTSSVQFSAVTSHLHCSWCTMFGSSESVTDMECICTVRPTRSGKEKQKKVGKNIL
jgi:hypothetical protein